MDVTRQSLVEHFQLLSDDELLAEFRHGDLTELAKSVVAEELGRRKIDPLQIPSESPADEQATSISGDLVLVARYFTAAEAHILRSRLELEGVPATVTDDNMAHTLGWVPVGGVRVLVPESNIQRAREIVCAIERGDYTLDN
jgi:Putative prokaryotic signal transducing protein